MDYLSLYITSKIMHIPPKNKKLALSAAIGAIYSVAIIALSPNSTITAFFSIAVSLVMTFVAYGKQTVAKFAKNSIAFYAVSFTLGGGITAICNLLNIWQNSRQIVINGTFDTVYGDLPFGLLIIIALGCGLFSLLSGKLIKKHSEIQVCELEIAIKNNVVNFQALVDSGNLLKEPISSKPVIIVTFDAIRSILPVETFSLFKTKDINIEYEALKNAKIRIIPTSTVGGRGVLFALAPDYVKINEDLADTYIAVDCNQKNFGEYAAIVPSSLIQ